MQNSPDHPLRAYRASKNVRIAELAAAVGVAKSTISRIENREMQPSLGLMSRLIAATGGEVSANDFLTPAPTEAA